MQNHTSLSPIPIPHHWKEEVKRQLDQDVDMGVVRKVSVGEADEWCSQIVVVGKKDGKPRRTGFSKPNSFLQTRNSIHLHHVVSNIPPKSYKTILDAYNGKHGITINLHKFKFAKREVQFVGYQIGWDIYKPSKEMLSAVKEFPMPENPSLSDIRSFSGLVTQLAPFVASSSVMSPFRDALKPSKAIGTSFISEQNIN